VLQRVGDVIFYDITLFTRITYKGISNIFKLEILIVWPTLIDTKTYSHLKNPIKDLFSEPIIDQNLKLVT